MLTSTVRADRIAFHRRQHTPLQDMARQRSPRQDLASTFDPARTPRTPLAALPRQPNHRLTTHVKLQPIDARGARQSPAPLPTLTEDLRWQLRLPTQRVGSANAVSPTLRAILPPVRTPAWSAPARNGPPDDGSTLSWTVKQDLQVLIEGFVKKQRERSCEQWQPIRSGKRALETIKGPSMLERWTADNYATWARGPMSDGLSFEGAASFEAVLRSYFRTASAVGLEAMLQFAEPAVKWAKEDDARRRWIQYTQARLTPQIISAFPNEKEDTVGELSVELFVEAVGLHRQGVSPEMAARTLELLHHADVTLGADQRLDEVYKTADEDGTIDVKQLIQSVAWYPSLRAAFGEILVLGNAVKTRKLLAGGFRGACRRTLMAATMASTEGQCVRAFMA